MHHCTEPRPPPLPPRPINERRPRRSSTPPAVCYFVKANSIKSSLRARSKKTTDRKKTTNKQVNAKEKEKTLWFLYIKILVCHFTYIYIYIYKALYLLK